MIICLGSGLHLFHLDTFSFWIDESLTPLRSSYSFWDILSNRIYVQGYPTQDTHPPVYYLIISVTSKLLGGTEFAYRFPSSLFAVISIPLMYKLGRRITGREAAGLLAALIFAINPLIVWYAQEARMYTLLTLLGIVLTYFLWRAIEEADNETALTRWFGAYAFVALLAVLTQLSAVFFIAGQGLIWAVLLWRKTWFGRWLIGGGVLVGLIVIPFLPRLVPRLFTPAESGFRPLPFSTILQDLMRGYGRGITTLPVEWLGDLLWWGYLLALVCSVSIGEPAKMGAFSLLTVTLIMPAIGISLISSIKPMYQGVRHIMLGSIGYILLLAVAADGLFFEGQSRSDSFSETSGRFNTPLRAAGLLVLLVTLVGSATSIYTLYTDPAVAKDDLRTLVQTIEQSAGEQDLVIYTDAILMLTHAYYSQRDDLPFTTLPRYPHPPDLSTALDLEAFSSESRRIWFVPSTAADRRDPNRVVQSWLEENGLLRDEKWFDATSAELKVEVYQTAGSNNDVRGAAFDTVAVSVTPSLDA